MNAIVTRRHRHNEDTATLWLRPEKPLRFAAGQFVMAGLKDAQGALQRRAYSLCSAPEDSELEITFRLNPQGRLTPLLFRLQEGDALEVEGPYGRFRLTEGVAHAVFIAGGTGIAPLMSMLRHIQKGGWKTKVSVVYGARSEDGILYKDEIEAYAKEGNLAFTKVVPTEGSVPEGDIPGRITAEKLKGVAASPDDAEFYLCGPPQMVRDVEAVLAGLGVQKERIKTDKWQ